MIPVFADAGYLIALNSQRDQHHAQAVRHWKEFGRTHPTLVTTTFVLAEVIAVFNNRSGHAKAVEIGRRFFDSQGVRLVHPERGHLPGCVRLPGGAARQGVFPG